MDKKDIEEIPIEIPPERLSEQILNSIIENFILREGTDYGSVEVSHEKKVEQVRKQIDSGKIKIVFDAASETVSLLTSHQYARLRAGRRPPETET